MNLDKKVCRIYFGSVVIVSPIRNGTMWGFELIRFGQR